MSSAAQSVTLSVTTDCFPQHYSRLVLCNVQSEGRNELYGVLKNVNFHGCAMAQAVGRQPLTADTVALGRVVSSTSVFPCQYIPQILHAYRHSNAITAFKESSAPTDIRRHWTESFCDVLLLAHCSVLANVSRGFVMVADTVGSSEFRFTSTRLRGVTILKITDFLYSNMNTSDPTELQNCYWFLPYFGR